MPHEALVRVVSELSLARDMPAVMAIVRRAARELTGADGATFVLRDGELCHYADEDAIGPLWKGQRFPMDQCISGWAMKHAKAAVVEDIFTDPRIPVSAYEKTFVRSVVMVPIRTAEPVGAIGAYWAERRVATAREVELLQALADSTAVAIENVAMFREATRWRALLEAASDSIWALDSESGTGGLEGVTRWWASLTGRPVSDYVDENAWLEDVDPEDRERVALILAESRRGPSPYSAEYRMRCHDGRLRYVFARAVPVRHGDGSHELVGMISDVTREREADNELKRLYQESQQVRETLRQLSRRLLAAQDEERRRISRDLHDDLGQVLTAVKMSLASLPPGVAPPAFDVSVRAAIESVDRSIKQTRDLSLQLYPPMLDILGLSATLPWYLGERLRGASVVPHVSIDLSQARFPNGVEIACYRVIQEAVTNVLQHAAARQIWVEVDEGPRLLRMEVRDDGRGFEPTEMRARAARGESAGLAGMQERVALAGGSFELRSRPGGGTQVSAAFPIDGSA